jgi:hypothetical protein
LYRSPARYPKGNFFVDLTFDAAGSFIGVMTARDPTNGREFVAVFPFSVGKTDWWGPLKWVIVVLLFIVGVYVFVPKGGPRSAEPA